MLHGIDWYLVTDVSGQPLSPIFKGQAIDTFFDCLTLEEGSYRMSRNVRNYQSTLLNIAEQQISHLQSFSTSMFLKLLA